jgi:hypothetical protein
MTLIIKDSLIHKVHSLNVTDFQVKFRMWLFIGSVPSNMKLFDGTVPSNKKLYEFTP